MPRKVKAPLGFFLAGETRNSLEDLDQYAIGLSPEEAVQAWDDKTNVMSDEGSVIVEVYQLVLVGTYEVEQQTRLILSKVKDPPQ